MASVLDITTCIQGPGDDWDGLRIILHILLYLLIAVRNSVYLSSAEIIDVMDPKFLQFGNDAFMLWR